MCSLAGRGASDLEDLVQVAAEQVFRSYGTFQGRSDLKTWIFAICYRVLLRQRLWYRRWQLRFSPLDDAADMAADELSASAALEARERAFELRQALAQLSDKYRAVVVLHDLEELPVREIARIVDANELTVRSRLRDGRKQLHKLLHAATAAGTYGGKHELTSS
jgi:RNA polymerase sigma-70 factor (ECF subfamily)